MRRLAYLFIILLVSSACTGIAPTQTDGKFSYLDQHCREHARDMAGEADHEGRYRECMALHGYYVIPEMDAHLTGAH